MASIEKGMVVQLKSGGPFMTVTEVKDGTVWCVWFDKMDQKQGHFPLVAVNEARDDD